MSYTPYTITRVSLAAIFVYHGLVPKILFKDQQEIAMNTALMPFVEEGLALLGSGVVEVVYGLLLLVLWRKHWLVLPAMVFSVAVSIAILVKVPSLFTHAFNPFSTNLAVFVLGYMHLRSHVSETA